MKKSLKTLLILAATLSFTGQSDAAILKSDFIKNQIKKNVEASLNNKNIDKAEVNIKNIPYKTINIPDGRIEIRTSGNIRSYSSSSILKTEILVNDKKVKSFCTSADIKIYDNVWVSKDNLRKGAILSWSNLSLEKKQINVFSKNALKNDFNPVGFQVTRSLKSGDILDKKFVKKIPLIVKDSPVSIIFKTPYVSVTLPGMALEEGNIGDFIRVKNKQYKKNFVGKIVGNNIIKVNI